MNSPGLKNRNGWFAAGPEWQRALHKLSDGAFKLFVWISLHAEWATGRLSFRQGELAHTLGKSRRSIGTYLEELERKRVCRRFSAPNQYLDGILQVSEEYWPYQGQPNAASREGQEERKYLEAIRKLLLDQPCIRFALSAADRQLARQWVQQAIPWEEVEQAILIGCGRKYGSWLDGQASEPIGSLHYFNPILEEIARLTLSPGYCAFNRLQVERLKQRWLKTQSKVQKVHTLNSKSACENFTQAKTPKTRETR